MTIERHISPYIESQFPAFYREEGPLFVQFLKAYYEWMEQSGNVLDQSRNLLEYRDIDTTLDQFIVYFKDKYMQGIPDDVLGDKRLLQKHIKEVFSTKGTTQGLKLLFRLLYNDDASVYYPSDDVLKPSDGEWVSPVYLEVSANPLNVLLINEVITGRESGATAVVESVETRYINRRQINVLFISNVRGDFKTKEILLSDVISDPTKSPVVIGSMTDIEINESGFEFKVGDILEIQGGSGVLGKAVVSNTSPRNGAVTFTINSGGSGYANNNAYAPTTVEVLPVNLTFSNTVLGYGDGNTSSYTLKDSGGIPLTHAIVSDIYETNWQGKVLLSNNPRTNQIANSDKLYNWSKFGNSPTVYYGPDVVANEMVFTNTPVIVGGGAAWYGIMDGVVTYQANKTYVMGLIFDSLYGSTIRFSVQAPTSASTHTDEVLQIDYSNTSSPVVTTTAGVNLFNFGTPVTKDLGNGIWLVYVTAVPTLDSSTYGTGVLAFISTGSTAANAVIHPLAASFVEESDFGQFISTATSALSVTDYTQNNAIISLGQVPLGPFINAESFAVGTNTSSVYTATIAGSNVSGFSYEPVIHRTDWQGRELLYRFPRTNLAPYSSFTGNTGWNLYYGANASGSVVYSNTGGPDGKGFATVTIDTVLSDSGLQFFSTTPANTEVWTLSTYLRNNGNTAISIRLRTQFGELPISVPADSQWHRYSYEVTIGSYVGSTFFRPVEFWTGGSLSGTIDVGATMLMKGFDKPAYVENPTSNTISGTTVTDFTANLSTGSITLASNLASSATLDWSGYPIGNFANGAALTWDGYGSSNPGIGATFAIGDIANTEIITTPVDEIAPYQNTSIGSADYGFPSSNNTVSTSNTNLAYTVGANTITLTDDFGNGLSSDTVQHMYLTNWEGTNELYSTPRTNEIIESTDLTSNAWTRSATANVVTSNVAAPDGVSFYADLTSFGSGTFSSIYQANATPVTEGTTHSIRVVVKYKDQQYFTIVEEAWAPGYRVTADLLAGTLTFGTSGITANLTPYGSNAYLLTANFLVPSGQTTFQPKLWVGQYTSANVANTGVYLFAPQQGDVVGRYIPTTSSAVTVTDYTDNNNGTVTLGQSTANGDVYKWTGVGTSSAENINTILNQALNVQDITVGSIVNLRAINPGTGYNGPVLVTVTNDVIAGLNITDTIVGGVKGKNANVTGSASIGNGAIDAVKIINAGAGYLEGDVVTLFNANVPYVAGGTILLGKQGVGEGYWKNSRGFLDYDKYIQDSYYYQDYSYEVRASYAFEYYADLLRKIWHPAGTEPFGKVVAIDVVESGSKIEEAQIDNIFLTTYVTNYSTLVSTNRLTSSQYVTMYATTYYTAKSTDTFRSTTTTLLASLAELIVNGTFDVDLSSWSNTAGASITWSSNTMLVTTDGTANAGAYQSFATNSSNTYYIQADITNATQPGNTYIGLSTDATIGNVFASSVVTSGNGTVAFAANATSNTTYLIIYRDSIDGAGSFNVDNVSAKALPDKTVNTIYLTNYVTLTSRSTSVATTASTSTTFDTGYTTTFLTQQLTASVFSTNFATARATVTTYSTLFDTTILTNRLTDTTIATVKSTNFATTTQFATTYDTIFTTNRATTTTGSTAYATNRLTTGSTSTVYDTAFATSHSTTTAYATNFATSRATTTSRTTTYNTTYVSSALTSRLTTTTKGTTIATAFVTNYVTSFVSTYATVYDTSRLTVFNTTTSRATGTSRVTTTSRSTTTSFNTTTVFNTTTTYGTLASFASYVPSQRHTSFYYATVLTSRATATSRATGTSRATTTHFGTTTSYNTTTAFLTSTNRTTVYGTTRLSSVATSRATSATTSRNTSYATSTSTATSYLTSVNVARSTSIVTSFATTTAFDTVFDTAIATTTTFDTTYSTQRATATQKLTTFDTVIATNKVTSTAFLTNYATSVLTSRSTDTVFNTTGSTSYGTKTAFNTSYGTSRITQKSTTTAYDTVFNTQTYKTTNIATSRDTFIATNRSTVTGFLTTYVTAFDTTTTFLTNRNTAFVDIPTTFQTYYATTTMAATNYDTGLATAVNTTTNYDTQYATSRVTSLNTSTNL